jgi:DNA-binding SARP family transcriptional activator
VYVAGPDGAPLGGAAGQRRLLALLAALAVAGDAGLSREKLIGLLWPDAEEERARHSLTQTLYATRRAVGADDLFVSAGDIRLNRERITTDLQELDEAIEAGRSEDAVALYQGPFLDGFFLPGSAEFEQWSALQRARFEDRIVGALDRLADRAELEGDERAVVEWRKRAAGIRPLDASTAVRVMTALAQVGDRAGALQHARLHEVLLREQLGLEPDPAVTALTARLREGSLWTPAVPAVAVDVRDDAPESYTATVETPEPEVVAVVPESAAEAPIREVAAPHATRPRNRLAFAALAVAVVAVVLAVVSFLSRPAPPPPSSALRQQVVVAPFRVAGASESLTYLREGLVELLSARLADDSAARSVDAGAVLAAWRAAGLAGTADVSRETVVRLAQTLGAERVVIGSVVGSPSRAVLSASVVSVRTGAVTGEASVEGPADSVTSLVDRLAGKLLVVQAGEDASLANQTTESLRALRAFLDGQAAFRRMDYGSALRRYDAALQLDSTFALAALQLVRAADRLHTGEGRQRALSLAWRHRDALGDRDRALLVATAGPSFPAPSPAADLLAAWQRLTDLTPDRADAWYELGALLFHDGATLGTALGPAAARDRAAAALRRAVALDSSFVPARVLLAHLLLGGRDPTAVRPADTAAAAVGPYAPFVRWRAALARHDVAALRHMHDTLTLLGPANLRLIAQASQFDAAGLDEGRLAARTLRERGGRLVERLEATSAEHSLALNGGRRREALDATDRLQDLQASSHAHLRLRVLDALYGDGSASAGRAAAAELARGVAVRAAAVPSARSVQLADACVLAHWRLAHGDTAGVQRAIDALRAESEEDDLPPFAARPAACAELLDASLAVAAGRPDAAERVARLDSLSLTSAATGQASMYAPLLLARLFERLGDPARALEAVRKRPYMTGWPRYLATMLREEGRYATLAGEPARAAAPYAHYLALRAEPDDELVAQADSVRQAARALGAAR